MKKRLVVIAEYFPPRLGADRRIFELMRRLAGKYDIHFITLPPSYTLFIRQLETSDEGKNEILWEGMKGHSLHLTNAISSLWTKSFLIAFAITEIYLCGQMLKKMIQLRPHMVIINDTSVYTGLLGFVCSKITNRKLIVDYNDLMGLYTLELVGKKMGGFMQAILGRILIMIEDTLVRYGWKVTAITEFIREYASARNVRENITVIPNGVDTSLFDPTKANGKEIRSMYGVRNGEKLCVYAGRVEEVAGARTILDTAKLLQHDRNMKFLIVGEGNPEMMKQLSRCDNVILTGRVPKEVIPNYLAAADCVFVPFADNVACHGISPLKLFEALAMGKPVVASAISGIREAVHENPNVFLVSNDPARWASAVTEIVNDSERSRKNGQISREMICQKYDFDHLAAVFDEVIESGL